MIYHQRKAYDSAINEFTFAMRHYEYPYALDKRAKTYVAMKKLPFALQDYRKAFEINKDYGRQLGDLFLLMNQKDSARKYHSMQKS
jgi:tetratricopeptide (TPR) repeat protein